MAVAATDIRMYLSANHAEADTGTQGGAQDANGRVLEDQFAAAAAVSLQSSSASDTQNATVTGRLTTGDIDTEVIAITGTTAATGSKSFNRILKISLASVAVGSITVKQGAGGTTRHTFLAGEDLCRSFFYGAVADPAGGSSQVRYEKLFVENTHATDSALTVTFELTTNPSSRYAIVVEDALDDNESVANRKTAPTGITGAFGAGPFDCVGTSGTLAAGQAQGLWIRQTLPAGDTPGADEPVITTSLTTA